MNEKRNYFIKEIKQNELISKKLKKKKKIHKILNYTEHFFILATAVTGYISIFNFASLVGIPVGIANSAAAMKICILTAEIKKYMSVIKKKKKKHDKIVLLAKLKLNTVEVLIYKD